MRFAISAVSAVSGLLLLGLAFYGQPAVYLRQAGEQWDALMDRPSADQQVADTDAGFDRAAQLQQEIIRLERELAARRAPASQAEANVAGLPAWQEPVAPKAAVGSAPPSAVPSDPPGPVASAASSPAASAPSEPVVTAIPEPAAGPVAALPGPGAAAPVAALPGPRVAAASPGSTAPPASPGAIASMVIAPPPEVPKVTPPIPLVSAAPTQVRPPIQVPERREASLEPATPRPEQAKPEQAKPAQAKPEQAKPEQAKPEQTKPELAKLAQVKTEQAKPEPAKPTQVKPEPVKTEPAKSEPPKSEPTRVEPPKPEPPRPGAPKAVALKPIPAPPPLPQPSPPQSFVAQSAAPQSVAPQSFAAQSSPSRQETEDTQSVLARLRQLGSPGAPSQQVDASSTLEPRPRPAPSPSLPRLSAARAALANGQIEDARRLLQQAQLQLVFRPVDGAADDMPTAGKGASDVARALDALSANDVALSRRYIDVAIGDLSGNPTNPPIQQSDRRVSGYAPAYPPR